MKGKLFPQEPEKSLEESLKDLQEIEKELRKRSHVSKCKSIFQCPKLHTDQGCDKLLNLETSILWEAANILNRVSDILRLSVMDPTEHWRRWKLNMITALRECLRSLSFVLDRHFQEYGTSDEILMKARHLVSEIVFDLEDQIGKPPPIVF